MRADNRGVPPRIRLLAFLVAPMVAALEALVAIETADPQLLAAVGPWIPGVCDYEPTPMRTIRRGLRRLDVTPDDVFVDVGSGKGRVVLEAARRPFRRVVGVELLPGLHDRAAINARADRRRTRCREIELVRGDALRAGIPDDATVLFLFNPFLGDIAEGFFACVRESLERRPRRLRLLYLDAEPDEAAALRRAFPGLRAEPLGAGLTLYEL